ncbi:AraC family transcriptional regulator [Nocardia farcinica]|uniref:AraC family transcriptional regulator n=1 Tax=Nocardia farcinica TaxID=37329 RepID=UPI001E48ABA1|nr:AraC family transcriptional regulator [Nocardia farcinica]
MTWEWRRTVGLSAVLVEVAAEHGLGVRACLRGTGIDPALLNTPDGEVTAAQELALVRNIVTALGDPPGLGLAAGARTHVTSYGALGLALLASPTVRSAVDLLMRYIRMTTTFARIWHVYRDDELHLYADDSDVPAELRGFLLERDVTVLLANWAAVYHAPAPVLRGSVSGGLRPRLQPLIDEYGLHCVVDGVGPHLVVFDTSGFEDPLPQASPLTARLFEQQCAQLLHRRGLRHGIAGTVREVLLRRMGERVGQEEMATLLHMSLRTLRRRLAEEGTSYRGLCSQTYGELAEELLAGGLTVEDVAYRMGYAGAPSFSTAFKQWRGISPGHFARAVAPRRGATAPGRRQISITESATTRPPSRTQPSESHSVNSCEPAPWVILRP